MPIEDPVWESFAKYRAEHREAVARREEEMRQRNRETGSGEKENVEHWQFLQKKRFLFPCVVLKLECGVLGSVAVERNSERQKN